MIQPINYTLSLFLGGNEAVNNTMHQQLPASSYAGLPHAPTIQQVNNLGPVNPEPQSPINPALMAQPNQQQMQVKLRHYEKATKLKKNLPLVLTKQLFLLSRVKTSGRFFQIFVDFSGKLNFNSSNAIEVV